MDNLLPLLRRKLDIKQRDLAKDLAVSPSYLCKVEKGLVDPTVNFKELCAAFFDESIETIFPEKKKKKRIHTDSMFHNNIWSIRQKKDIRQNKLAEMIGCSPSYLSKVEKGIQEPNEKFRKKCAKILRTKETELFPVRDTAE